MCRIVVTVEYNRSDEIDLVGERDENEDKEVRDEPHLGRNQSIIVVKASLPEEECAEEKECDD